MADVSFSHVKPRNRISLALISSSAFAFLIGAGGCAGQSSARQQCPSQAWVGKCALSDLRKVEEREMPLPWVVYEAIYSPQSNAEYPNFMPPEAHARFGAPAKDEFAMVDQLKAQAIVSCHAASTPGSCLPRDLVVDVTPFDPNTASAAARPRVTGCAAIDAPSEQDRLAQSRAEAATLSERFSFGEGSTELAPEATSDATVIAKRMADDPSIECIGLIGQASPGESPSLAEARARAVKRLLVSLGVESTRLQTIAATASVYGAASASTVPAAEQRRVSVSVLLKTTEKRSQ